MATIVSMSRINEAVANQPTSIQVNVQNTGAAMLTLVSLSTNETTGGAIVAQPNILVPGMALGFGNPTIAAGATVSYVFDVVFPQPNGPGPNPSASNDPAGGSAGVYVGQPADPFFYVNAQAQTSDNVTAQASLMVPVLSAIAPFPRPEGGAFGFTQGSNLINGITTGVL